MPSAWKVAAWAVVLFGLLIGLRTVPASAERWLRALPSEKPHSGAFRWFDVDSVVIDKKSNMVLVHVAAATANVVRTGKVGNWTMWGFECKGRKAFSIGTVGSDGKPAQAPNWRTDPKAVVALDGGSADPAIGAIATRVCGWIDIWPPGNLP
jgi:hypothetical protein